MEEEIKQEFLTYKGKHIVTMTREELLEGFTFICRQEIRRRRDRKAVQELMREKEGAK